MRMLEKTLAIGILLSLILKFSLISGGDVLLLCATLLLACIYYPLGFLFFNQIRLRDVFKKDAYKDVSALNIIIAVIAGIGLSLVCIGSLFRLLIFMGADEMLTIGLIVTAIALVICMVNFLRKRDLASKFVLWRGGVVGVIGLILLLTSELSIVKVQYRNHPDYIEAYARHLDDPGNEELLKKKELERHRIILTAEEFDVYERSVNK